MKNNKNMLAVTAIVLCGVIIVWLSTSIQGGQTTYELRPQVTVPEHRTDVTRIVDAYERLMERYMDLTESNMATVGTDLRAVLTRLDSIDSSLKELSERTKRIEKTLGMQEAGK